MVAKQKDTAIEIQEIQMGTVRVNIIGTSPMIMHRFSAKARRELLLPKKKANRAEKETSLKHDPVAEFRETIYMNRNPEEPSCVHLPTNAFSKAMANAALDIPGASKSQMLRLVSVISTQVNIFGIPSLFMSMVRSSDMAKTPDVRTRALFPEWACTLEIEFVSSLIRGNQIANLLAAAGKIVGMGDWRPQKGGQYGKFRICDDDDADFIRILKTQGRVPQLEAIAAAAPYDDESEELLLWFKEEVKNREKVVPSDLSDGANFDPSVNPSPESLKVKKKGNGHATA